MQEVKIVLRGVSSGLRGLIRERIEQSLQQNPPSTPEQAYQRIQAIVAEFDLRAEMDC
jgi:hypothetical protein